MVLLLSRQHLINRLQLLVLLHGFNVLHFIFSVLHKCLDKIPNLRLFKNSKYMLLRNCSVTEKLKYSSTEYTTAR